MEYETASELIAFQEYKETNLNHRRLVVIEACSKLKSIHDATSMTSELKEPRFMIDTGVMSQVFPLLDLILLEGVYPSLSKGVGFPRERQKRSTVCNRSCVSFLDLKVMHEVLAVLNPIVFNSAGGIHPQFQDSFLLDMIAANADLAYSPLREIDERLSSSKSLSTYLKNVSTSRLHQTLTVLIKASAPQWLRNGLSHHLSLLPMRPRGVRQTIEFLASYYDMPLPDGGQSSTGTARRTLISPEAISQATKILTSVPSSLPERHYYSAIAPQLLSLLDGENGPELSSAAATIITNGILNKRTIGAPGTIGWEILIEPQIRALEPDLSTFAAIPSKELSAEILVSQAALERSTKHLLALVSASINPALTGRILRPVLLQLWGLTAFDDPSPVAKSSTATARQLLEIFLQRCGNISHLELIRDNLSWDGELAWIFGPGETGGIAIRKRRTEQQEPNIMEVVSRTDSRITKFVEILSKSQLDDELISDFFRQSLKSLLHISDTASDMSSKVLLRYEQDPIKDLSTVQLVQALLGHFGENLASKPHQILSLIDQLLLETVESLKMARKVHTLSNGPSLDIISNIARKKPLPQIASDSDISDDIVATSISLLNALISSQDFKKDVNVEIVLHSILSHLQNIEKMGSTLLSQPTLAAIKTAVSSVQSIAKFNQSITSAPKQDATQISSRLAESFANDPPPIQASTLHNLLQIIDHLDTPLDIPGLTTIILNQIRFNKDTYVHPFLYEALARLTARRSPGYPIRAAVTAFRDPDEQTELNGRLRLGEAISTIVETLADETSDFTGEMSSIMTTVATACIAVAGRRSTRTLEKMERDIAERKTKSDQRRAEKAWGGEIPNLANLQDQDDDERDDVTREKETKDNAAIERIIRGWEGSGKIEDIRVRTTAMSVLGVVAERAGPLFSTELVSSAIDLALAILSFETEEDASILRRAAVLMFMSHLRAVDTGRENQIDVPSVDGGKWLEVERALSLANKVDGDDLTRQNAAAVLESLEILRMKQLLGGQENETYDSNSLGLTRLQGLSVRPDAPQGKRPKIDIIE
jgi:hypothetical protein